MRVFRNIDRATRTVELNDAEIALIEVAIPHVVAKMVAQKFLEENWEEIRSNKTFVREAKKLAIELAAEKMAERITVKAVEGISADTDKEKES